MTSMNTVIFIRDKANFDNLVAAGKICLSEWRSAEDFSLIDTISELRISFLEIVKSADPHAEASKLTGDNRQLIEKMLAEKTPSEWLELFNQGSVVEG